MTIKQIAVLQTVKFLFIVMVAMGLFMLALYNIPLDILMMAISFGFLLYTIFIFYKIKLAQLEYESEKRKDCAENQIET